MTKEELQDLIVDDFAMGYSMANEITKKEDDEKQKS